MFEYTTLSPDLKFLTVAAHVRGRYVRDSRFHVIAPDLNSASQPERAAGALVDFVDSLTTEQLAALFTSGIEVRDLTMEQLFDCMPLFMNEEQLESVFNGEELALITVRPTLSVNPVADEQTGPAAKYNRYLVDPMLLHKQSAFGLADENGAIRKREGPWTPPKLQSIEFVEGELTFVNFLTNLGGLVDYLSKHFELRLKIDPRLHSHHVFVHGNVDRESAIRLVTLLADVELPGVKVEEELSRRIDALHQRALEAWDQVADQSKVELTSEELAMFFEQATISASQLDGGTGRFKELFERSQISMQDRVQLLFELDWHISSFGTYPALDENRQPRTLPTGSRFVMSNNINQLISRQSSRP